MKNATGKFAHQPHRYKTLAAKLQRARQGRIVAQEAGCSSEELSRHMMRCHFVWQELEIARVSLDFS